MPIQPRHFGSDTLVVGIDVARSSHVAVAQFSDHSTSKPLTFTNDRIGFEAFAAWLRQAAAKAGTARTVVAFEPTGHYWKPLGEFLETLGVELRMMPPVFTKRAKDLLDGSPNKTDAKDAALIADLTRTGKSRPLYVRSNEVQELRYFVELRERVMRDRTANLNRLHRLLDILFPEILGLFSRIDCKSLLALLESAPTPGSVLEIGVEVLTTLLESASSGQYGSEKALEIMAAAQASIGCRRGRMPLIVEVFLIVRRIREIDSTLAAIEHELGEILRTVDYGALLLTIPGFGVVSAAVVIAELGDLRLYRNARQVIKMAGLNLFENSSGLHHGQKRITKRGRALLRKILYLAVIRQAGAKGMYGAYFKAHSPAKPKAKIAVAAMRDLLRVIFAMVRDGKPYQNSSAEKPPKPVRQALAA